MTLVYRGENILRGFDDDVRAHLRTEMEKRGIRFSCGSTVDRRRAERRRVSARLSSGNRRRRRQGDVRHRAATRTSTGLGLEKAGVAIAANGGIAVDEFSQTSVPHIYAVGDVTNRVNLTPVAIREGHAFADTVFGGKPTAVDHANVPTAVFSEPEVGADRPHRGGGARTLGEHRHLQDVVPADEGDACPAATRRVLLKLVVDGDDRPRGRLPYRRGRTPAR